MYRIFNIIFFLFHICSLCYCNTIHVFGDSHACYCFSSSEDFEGTINRSFEYSVQLKEEKKVKFFVHWLGPKTMHGFTKSEINLESFEVKEGDVCCFLLGEIDVRCHILKQSNLKNLAVHQVVDELLNRYFIKLENLKKGYKYIRYVLVSIVPPSDFTYNPEYPIIGSLTDRIFVSQLVNKKIRNWCAENFYIFLDVYDHYSDREGALLFSKTNDGLHVDPKTNVYIKELLINLLYSN